MITDPLYVSTAIEGNSDSLTSSLDPFSPRFASVRSTMSLFPMPAPTMQFYQQSAQVSLSSVTSCSIGSMELSRGAFPKPVEDHAPDPHLPSGGGQRKKTKKLQGERKWRRTGAIACLLCRERKVACGSQLFRGLEPCL